jgi:8-oxo-dGTP pyrophosphatase MutT (NUDIX family)
MSKFSSILDKMKDSNSKQLLENIKMSYNESLDYDPSESFDAAGFMFICPSNQSVLIGKRTKDNKWADFGGGREENETPLETAIREVSEELQFYPDMYKILPNPLINREDDGFVFYNYLAIVDDEIIPDINEEHSECKWIKFKDIGKYDLIKGMVNIFSHASNVKRVLEVINGKTNNAKYMEENDYE